MNWEGVMPAITTKFTNDDKLDIDLFNKANFEDLEVLYKLFKKNFSENFYIEILVRNC